MRKVWLDVETTGLDKDKNGIIQLACIMEDFDGKAVDEFSINMKPFAGCIYNKDAEKVHGKSEKVISKYTPEDAAIKLFISWLSKHKIGKEQFQISGYNSRFDLDFIDALFKRNTKFFWNFFHYYDVDVFALVKILDLDGTFEGKKSKKLVALCDTFNIEIEAHDAMSDIKATRKLYKKIMKRYIK